jgi:hypothetical protein
MGNDLAREPKRHFEAMKQSRVLVAFYNWTLFLSHLILSESELRFSIIPLVFDLGATHILQLSFLPSIYPVYSFHALEVKNMLVVQRVWGRLYWRVL